MKDTDKLSGRCPACGEERPIEMIEHRAEGDRIIYCCGHSSESGPDLNIGVQETISVFERLFEKIKDQRGKTIGETQVRSQKGTKSGRPAWWSLSIDRESRRYIRKVWEQNECGEWELVKDQNISFAEKKEIEKEKTKRRIVPPKKEEPIMGERYMLDEIKQKFIRYRELKRSQIADDEYDFFCDVLRILPREIIDRLDKDADLVLLSAQPVTVHPACFYRLDEEEKNRAGIIILTPLIFDFLWHPDIIEAKMKRSKTAILHEVAHFHVGTRSYESPEDRDQKENEADELAQKWIDDFSNEQSGDPADKEKPLRRGKMPEKTSTLLTFNLTYMMIQREEIVFVKLTSYPQLGEHIKWSFLGDPQRYSFAQFREMLSQTPYKRGSALKFYIVDEAAGRLEGIGIDISKDWPSGLVEDRIIARPGSVDISEPLRKLGLLEGLS